MNVWSWSAFLLKGVGEGLSGTKVYIHFFPVANGVSAPYPVQAYLEVFANGRLIERQGFEGLRINQPDGLDLADVFPNLFRGKLPSHQVEGSGPQLRADVLLDEQVETGTKKDSRAGAPLPQRAVQDDTTSFGITVQLGTTQPRIDLSRSRVIIEMCYPSHRLRYHAVQAGQELGARTREFSMSEESPVFAHEGYETKLIEVNPDPVEPALVGTIQDGSEKSLGGYSVRSLPIEKRHQPYAAGRITEEDGFIPAGRLPKASVSEEEEMEKVEEGDESIVRYLVQYEPTSSLPVSVRCI